MNKKIYVLPLGAAVLLFPACRHDHDHDHEGETDEHKEAEHGEKPGHDEHDGHEEHGGIHIEPTTAASFGIFTEKAKPADFAEVTIVSGALEAMPADEGVITATRSGILTLRPDIVQGATVGAGKSIGTIASSSVQAADPSLLPAARRDAAKRELDRVAPLLKDGVVSQADYNAALRAYEEAEAEVKSSRQGSASLTAPKSGIITMLNARSGQYVEAGTPVATVSGNTRLTLRADVPEKYASRIPGIASANVRTAASTQAVSLENLGGKLLPSSRVALGGFIPVRFSFANDGSMTPGSYAEVYLIGAKRSDVLSVPLEAVVEIGGNPVVYTFDGDDYEKHVVSLGASDGRRVEILSGLEAGEDVVVKGARAVRMAETSATAVPGHTHNH